MATSSFGPTALVTPANAVTAVRVAATPLLLAVIAGTGSSWPAFVLWTLLAGTDGIDGFLARRHGTTRSGAFLDPLADKFLVLGAMIVLVADGTFWWVPVTVIAGREAVISLYRAWLGKQGVTMPARPSAKVKTVVQDVAVGLALLPPTADHRWLFVTVLWAAVALTVVTGGQYLVDGRRVVR